jgi:hypothetical protein
MKRVRWILVVVVAVGVAVVAVRLSLRGYGVPDSLGPLKLAQAISGGDARLVVDRMHGHGVTPAENVVGTYRGEDGAATIYISYYPTPDSASSASDAMARRIEAGSSPFGHFRVYEMGTSPVFMCIGLGQVHFFFACQNRLYWLSADLGVAELTIRDLRKKACDQ